MADFRPFCVKCSIRMHCVKNEVYLVHKNDYVRFVHRRQRLTVQAADLYQCPNCQTQVLSGYGQPILAIGKEDSQYVRFAHRRQRLTVERFSQLGKKDGVFFEATLDISNH